MASHSRTAQDDCHTGEYCGSRGWGWNVKPSCRRCLLNMPPFPPTRGFAYLGELTAPTADFTRERITGNLYDSHLTSTYIYNFVDDLNATAFCAAAPPGHLGCEACYDAARGDQWIGRSDGGRPLHALSR